MAESSQGTRDLVASLAAGGEAVPGEFTVDAALAREKLARFALADPAQYLVLWVRGLIGAGATAVRVRQAGYDELELAWEAGPDLSAGGREGILARALGRRSPRRDIALAWFAAERAGIQPRIAGPRAVGLRGERPAEIDLVRGDLWHLYRCARYAEVPLSIDGERVSRGWHGLGPTPLAVTVVAGDGVVGRAAFLPHREPGGEIRFLRHGIWTATAPLERVGRRFVAVVDAEGLELDASELTAVENDAFGEARRASYEALKAASQVADVEAEEQAHERLDKDVAQRVGGHTGLRRRGWWWLYGAGCGVSFLAMAAYETFDVTRWTAERLLGAVVAAPFMALLPAFFGFTVVRPWLASIERRRVLAAFPPTDPLRRLALAEQGELRALYRVAGPVVAVIFVALVIGLWLAKPARVETSQGVAVVGVNLPLLALLLGYGGAWVGLWVQRKVRQWRGRGPTSTASTEGAG